MRHNQNIDEFFNTAYIHKPILWREIADFIKGSLKGGKGHLADCTLGEGGHSELFLNMFPELTVTGFERDSEILKKAKERLACFGDRISFVNGNFSEIADHFEGKQKPDYILYDFGISSYHFEKSGKGFTFSSDEPLDMSLDGGGLTAWHVVNKYPLKELERVFKEYGEENWAAHIAKIIVERRIKEPVNTTAQLANIVLAAIPKHFHVKNIHPATRIFQGIRIEVNRELQSIEEGLKGGFKILENDGVMMAISFHSLEDRIVKTFFRRMKDGCLCTAEPQHCMCMNKPFMKLLTKKPLEADEDEVAWNYRSRSAKLRAAVKIRDITK
ncbi:MAG TPA: 16S rRNA (cytosine(1402)-N(4))-methyltransferase RsmH [Spirochaetota bacterium]|mgnify:CR=1 FL=1|nr:16S rRNA (cytosine(1402)-N(4))-methyltransferase RsmH [Spirochaetota bacterium]HPS87561.1 16S rRNA (cytosine(1402)-N(4))-methyltransferase RsmH [Spirochaetota bacterium]